MLGIGKPDLTAPGLQILAGHTAQPAPAEAFGPAGQLFQVIQGTSMSSPHVAGAAALLKAGEPSWTPGQIKSALMLTAKAFGITGYSSATTATAYEYGSGRINLRRAGSPKLAMWDDGAAFLEHRADLWNTNHPSAHLPVMPGRMTLVRSVQSLLDEDSVWKVGVVAPADVKAHVRPRRLEVPAGGSAELRLSINARDVPQGVDRSLRLNMNDGERRLRMPVSLVRRQPVVTIERSCAPLAFPPGEQTRCTVTATNTGLDDVYVKIKEQLGGGVEFDAAGLVGARRAGGALKSELLLAGGAAAGAEVGVGDAPFGYVSLAGFPEIVPIDDVGDDEIIDFDTPGIAFAGVVHDTIGVASNGFVIMGGSTAAADASAVNQRMPDPALPNNVIAPAWTDLDPSSGGEIRVGSLSNSRTSWTVVDWYDVPNASDGELNSFQVWLGNGAQQDISFAYRTLSAGSDGRLTVGAENAPGTSGGILYHDGTGSLPDGATEAVVTSSAQTMGDSHVVEYVLNGAASGEWRGCTRLQGTTFQGTSLVCTWGSVLPGDP